MATRPPIDEAEIIVFSFVGVRGKKNIPLPGICLYRHAVKTAARFGFLASSRVRFSSSLISMRAFNRAPRRRKRQRPQIQTHGRSNEFLRGEWKRRKGESEREGKRGRDGRDVR